MNRLLVAILVSAAWLFPCSMYAQLSTSSGGLGFPDGFSSEVRLPATYQLPSVGESSLGVGVEYMMYGGSKVHDERYRNLLSEETRGPMSFLRGGIFYQPFSDLGFGTRGFSVELGGVKLVGGTYGMGGFARYTSTQLQSGVEISDFEVGPRMARWVDERTFIDERLLFRSVASDTSTKDAPRDLFVQLRHHLVYVPGEEFEFTYGHDLDVQVGVLGSPHTNTLIFTNYFLFSPLTAFSFGPVIGVRLDYFIGRGVSALSIPLRARFEYFTGPFVLMSEAGYTIKTMSGQETLGWRLHGTVGYRF